MDEVLPKVVREAEIKFGNLTMRVFHLDNGQRVIDAESMIRFMVALDDGSLLLSADDAAELIEGLLP